LNGSRLDEQKLPSPTVWIRTRNIEPNFDVTRAAAGQSGVGKHKSKKLARAPTGSRRRQKDRHQRVTAMMTSCQKVSGQWGGTCRTFPCKPVSQVPSADLAQPPLVCFRELKPQAGQCSYLTHAAARRNATCLTPPSWPQDRKRRLDCDRRNCKHEPRRRRRPGGCLDMTRARWKVYIMVDR
jgi:hypothetical protein